MRRLFVSPAQLAGARGGRLALLPEQARYLLAVLRLEPGAELEVFDGEGKCFSARVAGEGPALDLLGASLSPAAGPEVIVAQALAKGDKLELVVQKATELGASRIIPFAAERSVVRVDGERARARAERLRRIAAEAARQCGRTDVPAVDGPVTFAALIALGREDPGLRALLLVPGAVPLGSLAGAERLLLAVGPEGGFSADELRLSGEAGFLRASLGPRVLRTETAALAALAVVRHVQGTLG